MYSSWLEYTFGEQYDNKGSVKNIFHVNFTRTLLYLYIPEGIRTRYGNEESNLHEGQCALVVEKQAEA